MGLGLISKEGACHSTVTACYSAQVIFTPTPGQQCDRCPRLSFLGISVCRAPPRQAPRPGHESMFTLTTQAQANGKRGGPLLRGPRRHRSQRGTTSSCSSSRARRPSTRSARSRGRRPAAAATSGVPPCLGPGFCFGLLVIWYCLYRAACLRLPLNLNSRVSPSVSPCNRRRCRVLPLFAEELGGALGRGANLKLNNTRPDCRASMRPTEKP